MSCHLWDIVSALVSVPIIDGQLFTLFVTARGSGARGALCLSAVLLRLPCCVSALRTGCTVTASGVPDRH